LEEGAESREVVGRMQLGADVHLGDEVPPAKKLTAQTVTSLDLDREIHQP
jgi:hypothetical protein